MVFWFSLLHIFSGTIFKLNKCVINIGKISFFFMSPLQKRLNRIIFTASIKCKWWLLPYRIWFFPRQVGFVRVFFCWLKICTEVSNLNLFVRCYVSLIKRKNDEKLIFLHWTTDVLSYKKSLFFWFVDINFFFFFSNNHQLIWREKKWKKLFWCKVLTFIEWTGGKKRRKWNLVWSTKMCCGVVRSILESNDDW